MAAPTSHRRTFLRGSAGTIALFAGCLAEPDGSDPDSDPDSDAGSGDSDGSESDGSGASDDTDDTDDGTDSTADDADDTDDADNTDDADDGTDATTDALTYETSRYHYSDSATEPDATLLPDRSDATDWLAERGLEEDSLGGFVDDTPFADATLIALEATAPNACYEMVLEEIGVTAETDTDDTTPDGETTEGSDGGDSLELEATVRDESDESAVCAQALTTVGVLVRATVDAEPVTEISAVIVDGDGDDHEVDAVADTETEE